MEPQKSNSKIGNITSADMLRSYEILAGMLGLLIVATFVFSQVAIQAALNIPTHDNAVSIPLLTSVPLMRLGIASALIVQLCSIIYAWLLYLFLRAYNKQVASLSLLIRLSVIGLLAFNTLNLIELLILVNNDHYGTTFSNAQINQLAIQYIQAHNAGYHIGLVFFGLQGFLLAYLVSRSGFFPRFLGPMLYLSAFCYFGAGFTYILFPEISSFLLPWMLLGPLSAEISISSWVLFKGMDYEKWSYSGKHS